MLISKYKPLSEIKNCSEFFTVYSFHELFLLQIVNIKNYMK